MGLDTLTEGSDADTLRRVTRMSAGDDMALIGVLAPTTGGGSHGAGCRLSDGCDAMDNRMNHLSQQFSAVP